jgi:hypothetical protein
MHGELAGDLSRARAVAQLEALARSQVESDAFADRDARIEHVLVQRMDERIAARDRPSGHSATPVARRSWPRRASASQRRSPSWASMPSAVATAAENSAPATLATASIAARPPVQPLDLHLHHSPERLGRIHREILHRRREDPLPSTSTQLSAGEQIIDRVHQE